MTLKAAPIRVPTGWRLLDDVELMDLPDPEFIVDGILPRKGIGVLYGPSGACKTTLVAGLLTAIATGRDWFGFHICRRGSSAYVATEDVAGFKTRLRAAKLAASLTLDTAIGVYTFPEPIDLRDAGRIATFVRFVREADVRVELVVVDTYAAAMPGAAENSSEDTTLAMTAAQKMRSALDAAVLLVHHTNAGGSRERGHSSMRGAADTMIAVTPVDDVIHIECSKQRNGAPFEPLLLKLVPVPAGGCVLKRAIDVQPALGLTLTQDKVLKALRDTFDASGATKSDWRSACQDMPERTFHRVAKILVEGAYVRAAGNRFIAAESSR
jgi:hypothetical protein